MAVMEAVSCLGMRVLRTHTYKVKNIAVQGFIRNLGSFTLQVGAGMD